MTWVEPLSHACVIWFLDYVGLVLVHSRVFACPCIFLFLVDPSINGLYFFARLEMNQRQMALWKVLLDLADRENNDDLRTNRPFTNVKWELLVGELFNSAVTFWLTNNDSAPSPDRRIVSHALFTWVLPGTLLDIQFNHIQM
ncbi:hypothetical protein CFP56_011054 [Quercus suber]|uniref:Uncharacterized protein n=1 Tax=Quercus suber TaxID=58331 RepID=A0AAW0KX70_QUESU